jgi:hypothetical protein
LSWSFVRAGWLRTVELLAELAEEALDGSWR